MLQRRFREGKGVTINEELFYAIRRSNACLRRKRADGSVSHKGSGRLLDLLEDEKGTSQQQLADAAGLRAQTVSEMICVLEKNGWIKKLQSPDDRRQALIYITDEGKQARLYIREQRRKRADAFFEVLSDEEKQTLLELLNKINSEREG